MDWMKQSQDLFNTWANLQKETFENWLKALQAYDKSEPKQIWEKTVDAWQESVKATVNAQVEGARIWAEGVTSAEQLPKETADWANQMQKMQEEWSNMQLKMWDNWFEIARGAVPPGLTGTSWDNDMMKTWQDMAKKAMESQAEMVRSLTGSQK